jgi:uncharacterized protein with GYD domain
MKAAQAVVVAVLPLVPGGHSVGLVWAVFPGGETMSAYLFHLVHTPATLAKLIAAPEDRRAAIEPIFKAAGGSVLGFWYVVGGAEVYALGDLPDDVVATGIATKVISSGAFSSTTTTKLLTVEEMLTALGGSASTSYRAPGEPA